jgi:ABC-2 type transport system ATP-binding protein
VSGAAKQPGGGGALECGPAPRSAPASAGRPVSGSALGGPAARLIGVEKRYAQTGPTEVGLFGIDLELAGGEILALLGPNGAGKTTAVRILCGLLEPDRGRAEIGGFDLARDPLEARRQLGYVPDGAPLYAELDAWEHVDLVAGLHGLEPGLARQRAEAAFEGLELSAAADRPVGGYSRGMRQKLALALAILPRPRLLVLDEPLSGLDAPSTMIAKELLRRYAASGAAVLITSHLLDVVERLADRLVILRAGRVIASGPYAQLAAERGAATLEGLFAGLVQSASPADAAARILAE